MAARVGALAAQWREQLGLGGRLVAASRLHVTLTLVDREFDGPLPPARVAQVRALLDGMSWPSVNVCFDRLASFGRRDARPLVLTTEAPLPALEALAAQVTRRLEGGGVTGPDDHAFRPHMTLLYDAAAIEPRRVEPVSFNATGFDLVHSHIGQARYDPVAHWALPA